MQNVEGQIVFEGKTKNGQPFIIRYVKNGDASDMRDYINTLSVEKTFISFQGEQVSLGEEKAYIKEQLKKVEEGKSVQLSVYQERHLIGVCNLDARARAERHIANLGLSVAKDFRNQGVGSVLLQTAISEGQKNISELEIITLGVFATNLVARELYKKFGFLEYGSLPDGVKLENSYVDHIGMYKILT